MKKIWNIVSTSGAVLNKEPIKGTKEQAEAYMNLCFDFCALKEFEPMDLDEIECSQSIRNYQIFVLFNKNEVLFKFRIHQGKITLVDNDSHENIGVIHIDSILTFPKIKRFFKKMRYEI